MLDPHKAACRLARDEAGYRHTPDIDNCRPNCGNIAGTNRDIEDVHRRAERLTALVADPMAPPIRAARERSELARLTAIITEHEQGKA